MFTAMTPARQVAVAEAIAESQSQVEVELRPLLFASRPSELSADTFQNLGRTLLAEWNRQSADGSEALARRLEDAERNIGPMRLELVALGAFISRLLSAPRIAKCLADDHPKALEDLLAIGTVRTLPADRIRSRREKGPRWYEPGRA
jgi:hypothetical protein